MLVPALGTHGVSGSSTIGMLPSGASETGPLSMGPPSGVEPSGVTPPSGYTTPASLWSGPPSPSPTRGGLLLELHAYTPKAAVRLKEANKARRMAITPMERNRT